VPWPIVRHPSKATPLNRLRRQRAWRFRVRAPSRRFPRNPLVWADLLVLHPLKGLSVVLAAPLVASAVPVLAPVLELVVWAWRLLFPVGMARYLSLLRLRSGAWLRLEEALGLRSAALWARRQLVERTG
jgi:hypothetical protein